MSRPFWLSAFLDLPADRYDAGVGFWEDVTGFQRSRAAGRARRVRDAGPAGRRRLPAGPAARRRARRGPPRPARRRPRARPRTSVAGHGAERRGRRRRLPHPHLARRLHVLPGQPPGRRPARRPRSGPTATRRTSTRSASTSRRAGTTPSWTSGRADRLAAPRPEAGLGVRPAHPGRDLPLQLLLQRLDDEQDAVTAHLDWAATDHEAELAAHVAAGAEVVGPLRGLDGAERPGRPDLLRHPAPAPGDRTASERRARQPDPVPRRAPRDPPRARPAASTTRT